MRIHTCLLALLVVASVSIHPAFADSDPVRYCCNQSGATYSPAADRMVASIPQTISACGYFSPPFGTELCLFAYGVPAGLVTRQQRGGLQSDDTFLSCDQEKGSLMKSVDSLTQEKESLAEEKAGLQRSLEELQSQLAAKQVGGDAEVAEIKAPLWLQQ